MLASGSTVGNYRVLHKLGEGGMGVVFAAEHVVLGTRAAVKLLHGEAASNAEIVQRFINEARAAANLKHANVVGVLDCGQLADGQWYIALEFLDGMPLRKLIEQHAPIDLPTIIHILAEASNALQAAHDHGIVHRDIKPDNVFLTRTPSDPHHVTVLDFGIAKLKEENSGIQTRSGIALGTPSYMSPEQLLDGRSVDPRSDVYALAVVAYEMMTGRRPWADEGTPVAIYREQMQRAIPDPRALLAARGIQRDIPAAFVRVLVSALDPDPNARFRTVREFVLALAHATPGTPWTKSGIDIVRDRAPELTLVGAEGNTFVPHALAASSGPWSAPSPLPTAGGPANAQPATVALRPSAPVTTLGSSSGESVGRALSRARSRIALAVGATGVVVAGAIVALVVTRENKTSTRPTAAAATSSVDAGAMATARPDPIPPSPRPVAEPPAPVPGAPDGGAGAPDSPAGTAMSTTPPALPSEPASASAPSETKETSAGKTSRKGRHSKPRRDRADIQPTTQTSGFSPDDVAD